MRAVPPTIELVDPLLYNELLDALFAARVCVTDSGGLQKEAFWARVPCVTVRRTTEWMETVDAKANVLAQPGENLSEAVAGSVRLTLDPHFANPYGDGRGSEEIVEALLRWSADPRDTAGAVRRDSRARLVTPVRMAIAGLGTMGRQHVRLLGEMDSVELVAVCDHSSEARAWAEKNLELKAYDDWRALAEIDVEAIVNALPTPEHFEVTRTYLEAEKHVLVEKPIAVTVDEANGLLEVAEQSSRVLMVGHVERFNPAIQALREVIVSDELGEIINVAARRVGVARPTAPRTDVVIDLAIHDIDVCSFLLPSEQGRLRFASGATLGGNQLEDHADLVLSFGRTVAIVQANWITPVKIRRIAVTGTSGFAEVDYLSQSLRVYRGVPEVIKGPVWNFYAVAQESTPTDVPVTRCEPLRAELDHFVACVRDGVEPLADPRQATRALALAVEASRIIRGHASVF